MPTLAYGPRPLPARPSNPEGETTVFSTKPFLKWVGGKGRILASLFDLLPKGVNRMRHVEPFVGGGALFFASSPTRAFLADINPALIDTYRAVRDDVEGVIAALERFANCCSAADYYRIRAEYNRDKNKRSLTQVARFIYLNKTCFNGLYRVNRRGDFNVPQGRYAKPRVLHRDVLTKASTYLQRAELRSCSFESALEYVYPGDFVYFDPPYVPTSSTARFTGYGSSGFDDRDQKLLQEVFRALDERGCRLMLSNSDTPLARKLYRSWEITEVHAPRAVNSNANGRGKVRELIVRNYA